MSPPIRIGAVSYLNTRPLVYGLAERLPQAEVLYDLPSRLADRLAAGELDVALIPSIEFFHDPGYSIVSDACIGCRGPVWSVKLLSRVPGEKIRTLALDEGSRTSAALVQVLLKARFGIRPRCEPLPIEAPLETATADAILLIGDRAIGQQSGEWSLVWDLGEEWNRWAELPFVFAMWTARSGVDRRLLAEVDAALRACRDAGLAHLEEMAEREAGQFGLTPEQCLTYWRDNLHFYLGEREQRGLELFHRRAAELHLAPAPARTWRSVETNVA
jgi:chorismate dehydratase